MKYKIGVLGSAEYPEEKYLKKAVWLGRVLGGYKDKLMIFTGACSGIPHAVASEAAKLGVEVWGFSPASDFQGQKQEMPNDDLSIYKKFIYLPKNFQFINDIKVSRKYRNVILTALVDAGIIVGGRFGTLNEFTNLYDMGKIIGVYQGSGGVADNLEFILQKIKKKSQAQIFFDQSPEQLIKKILSTIEKNHY